MGGKTATRRGEIKISIERCKGCELCVLHCPRECIRLSKEINSKGVNYAEFINQEKCNGCATCGIICPDVAIEVWRESSK